MNRWGWYAVGGMIVAAGLAAAAVRTMRELFEAIEWDEDPFDEIMDTEDMAALWAGTIADIESEHFAAEDALVNDGEIPDVLMVGYGMHIDALPAALNGLWKTMMGDADQMDRTEGIVRAHTLVSQLRVLVAMYETYTNLGAMERVQDIDDNLGQMHHLIDQIGDE